MAAVQSFDDANVLEQVRKQSVRDLKAAGRVLVDWFAWRAKICLVDG